MPDVMRRIANFPEGVTCFDAVRAHEEALVKHCASPFRAM
jgi:hypothetical protein